MIRQRSSLILNLQKAIDLCITCAAFFLADFATSFFHPQGKWTLQHENVHEVTLLLLVALVIWSFAFERFGIYISYRNRSFFPVFVRVLKACTGSTLVLLFCIYAFKFTVLDRLFIICFVSLNIGLLALFKLIVFYGLRMIRAKGYNVRYILVVGSRSSARGFIEKVGEHPEAGYCIIGCIGLDEAEVGQSVSKACKVIGDIRSLESIMREYTVDELVFAIPLKSIENASQHIEMAEKMGVNVRIMPDWEIQNLLYHPTIATLQIDNFLGVYNLVLQSTPMDEGALFVKKGIDLSVSAVALFLLLPLFIMIGIMIRLFSGRPVLYTQTRLGLNGRKFKVYKFRTMVNDADKMRQELAQFNEASGPAFKIKDDPRIIPYLGTFLRRTGLDELPQLINVLRGEMSLVGPRPPLPDEVDMYTVWHRRRLSMKPGITCLWQIEPRRNELDFDQWMQLDLRYIDNWSLTQDIRIILRTIKTIFMGSGR